MCNYREVTIKSIEDIKSDITACSREIWKNNCKNEKCSDSEEEKCPRTVFLWILEYVTNLNISIEKNIKINTANGIHTLNILKEIEKENKLLNLSDKDLWDKLIPTITYNHQVDVIRVFLEQGYIDFDKLSKLEIK